MNHFSKLLITRMALLLSAFLILTACTPAVDETAVPEPGSTPGEGYPAPTSGFEGPGYPVEDAFAEIFEQNLTPHAPPPEVTTDLGALTLRMVYAGTDRPVRGQDFFAAVMLPVQGVENGFIPKLDPEVAKHASSDSEGVLVISNIEPGNYALTLMTPMGPILVESESTNDTVVFDIAAGEVTDLGTVSVLLDPGPLEP